MVSGYVTGHSARRITISGEELPRMWLRALNRLVTVISLLGSSQSVVEDDYGTHTVCVLR